MADFVEGDTGIRIRLEGGKEVTVRPATDPQVGENLLMFTLAGGKKVCVRPGDLPSGSTGISIPTAGGKRVVISPTGSGESSVPDPVKSVTLTMDGTINILVSWVPGDNNDAIHYEFGMSVIPEAVGDGDTSHTIDYQTTTNDEGITRFYAWYYVRIWGMKNGKYSSTSLTAAIYPPLAALDLHKLICYTTIPITTLPTEAGDPFYIVGGALGTFDLGTFTFYWSGAGAVRIAGLDSSDKPTVSMLSDDNTVATQTYGTKSGQSTGTGSNRSFTGIWDITSICNVGRNEIHLVHYNNYEIYNAWCESADTSGQLYFACSVTETGAGTSWTLYGDDSAPPNMENSSGVKRTSDPTNGAITGYAMTVWFHDGIGYNAYIAYRVADADTGVIEFVAGVVDQAIKKQLYIKNLQLCGNTESDLSATYHGYLNISEINTD